MSDWEISVPIQDGPVAWTAGFTLRESPEAFCLLLRLNLQADRQITPQELAAVQKDSKQAFRRYFDHRFFLQLAQQTPKPLRTELEFTSNQPHLSIQLSRGMGQARLDHWYTEAPAIEYAHELGHQLGLLDEYRDADFPHRSQPHGAGVFHDDSLMGNYRYPGGGLNPKAALRHRHGLRLAQLISQTLGTPFTISPSPTYLIQAGDTLTNIALRLYRSAEAWQELYEHNRELLPDRFRLPVGQALTLPKPCE
jgi:hypothetical protein